MQSNCSTQRGMDRENSQSRKLNQNSFQPCRKIKTIFSELEKNEWVSLSKLQNKGAERDRRR